MRKRFFPTQANSKQSNISKFYQFWGELQFRLNVPSFTVPFTLDIDVAKIRIVTYKESCRDIWCD